MLIVHFTNALRNDGTGITNSTVDLAIAQVDCGDEVWIICRESAPSMTDLLRQHGVRVFTSVAAVPRELAGLLRRSDIIHVHTVRGMWRALRCAPWAYWQKSVSTFHNPHQRATLLLLAARRVVALNTRDAGRLARLNPMRHPAVVRNGVLGSRRLPPAETVDAELLSAHSIVYVGALHHRKGLDVLLRAVAMIRQEVPDVRLYLVGNRDAPEFEGLSAELGVADCTTFVGFQPDPRGFMRGAGVFVLPSRDEGFGNVLTEARSVGAPIVASRVGGIPDALDGGEAGLLVPPGDAAALAIALTSVLTDKSVRDDLVRRSRIGLTTMTVSRFRDDYSEIYRSLSRAKQGVA